MERNTTENGKMGFATGQEQQSFPVFKTACLWDWWCTKGISKMVNGMAMERCCTPMVQSIPDGSKKEATMGMVLRSMPMTPSTRVSGKIT
jgi:hypothetical protein